MKPEKTNRRYMEERIIKPIYLFLLFTLGLTGFGQMPIFKRYYIADIPGLGWTAKFYVTHYLHYLGAVCLLFLIVYSLVVYLGLLRWFYAPSRAAYVRLVILAAIVFTGVFRVLKNLPDVTFSPGFTMFVDISHLAFMMLLMICGIVFMVTRSGWLVPRNAETHKGHADSGRFKRRIH